MSLALAIQSAEKVSEGVWKARLLPSEVQKLGDAHSTIGKRSVVGVIAPSYEAPSRRLLIEPAKTTVFNIGNSDDTILMDLGLVEAQKNEPRAQLERPWNNGDMQFLATCRREKLSEHLVNAAKKILTRLREKYDGQMKEGKARKWVNYPDNFLALVIQPRDNSFAIHVWGRPNKFSASSLEIKPDRSRYSRFKLAKPSQIDDALRVILESARLATGH
jgi:hypothetical protein